MEDIRDIKVMDTLKEMIEAEESLKKPFHPLAFFAEVVGSTRQESTGVSISDIAKCFRYQFDESELKALIKELQN